MEALVDPERVALARSGDAAAFEALVEARVGSMVRTAMAILGREDEARDAVQDTLVTAWRELASLRDPAAFDAWLTRILVNRCRRGLRTFGLTRMREIPADEVAEIDLPRTEDLAGAVVDRRSLERAFGRLSIDERTILVLHHLDGRPLASIAAVLKIPEGTAKSRLFKARRSLERAMEREAER
jgi:RNA polymerase sigma-70 factor (ECF subfamily)